MSMKWQTFSIRKSEADDAGSPAAVSAALALSTAARSVGIRDPASSVVMTSAVIALSGRSKNCLRRSAGRSIRAGRVLRDFLRLTRQRPRRGLPRALAGAQAGVG